jgi:hypothetical protein
MNAERNAEGSASVRRRLPPSSSPEPPGLAVVEPDRLLAAYAGYRRLREAQILETLELEGACSIQRLVARLFGHVDKGLHPAAAQAVLAHLINLAREGLVDCCQGLPTLGAVYRARRSRAAA